MPRPSRLTRGKSRAPKTVISVALTYEEQRMFWRHALSDDIVRALAADYIRGYKDECNEDAFKEYERRFGKHGATPAGKLKQSRRSRFSR